VSALKAAPESTARSLFVSLPKSCFTQSAFRARATETELKAFRCYPNPLDPGKGATLVIDRLPLMWTAWMF
jgi:hypothetical protein